MKRLSWWVSVLVNRIPWWISVVRRRWLSTFFTVLLTALAINIWIQEGGKVLLILAAVAGGLGVLIAAEFFTSGYQVARHAMKTQQVIAAIEARRQKELTQ